MHSGSWIGYSSHPTISAWVIRDESGQLVSSLSFADAVQR